MELTNLSFEYAKENGYYGENDLYNVLLFLKEQKGLSFDVVKNPSGDWNGFVRKDASEDTIKEFGSLAEPRIVYQIRISGSLTDEEAIDLLISYFSFN